MYLSRSIRPNKYPKIEFQIWSKARLPPSLPFLLFLGKFKCRNVVTRGAGLLVSLHSQHTRECWGSLKGARSASSGPRPRRGSCWEEWKRRVFPDFFVSIWPPILKYLALPGSSPGQPCLYASFDVVGRGNKLILVFSFFCRFPLSLFAERYMTKPQKKQRLNNRVFCLTACGYEAHYMQI